MGTSNVKIWVLVRYRLHLLQLEPQIVRWWITKPDYGKLADVLYSVPMSKGHILRILKGKTIGRTSAQGVVYNWLLTEIPEDANPNIFCIGKE